MPRVRYPFAAIVGQDPLKQAYLATIVDPRIGGLLISGSKGSGKSTIVYSIESILPSYQAIDGCPFQCDPQRPDTFCTFCQARPERSTVIRPMTIISLPLSCTEDRLIGSIDIEALLKRGERKIIPGIIGAAHQNILYIDEVNLLPDHLVDDILDVAALHWNTIEREGVSITHRSEFALVGSMNPEEGDLRPQILDRFPLCVKVGGLTDPVARAEVVKRNLAFEQDQEKFIRDWAQASDDLRNLIVRSRAQLASVQVDDELIAAVSRSCLDLKVDGQRPDIVIIKTARALAAIRGDRAVTADDIMMSSSWALVHRTRDGGLLEPPGPEEIGRIFDHQLRQAPAVRSSADSRTVRSKVEVILPAESAGTKPSGIKKNSKH